MDTDVYKNAKSTRPAWANALIIGLVALIAAFIALGVAGVDVLFFALLGAAGVAGVVAGILALLGVRRSA